MQDDGSKKISWEHTGNEDLPDESGIDFPMLLYVRSSLCHSASMFRPNLLAYQGCTSLLSVIEQFQTSGTIWEMCD